MPLPDYTPPSTSRIEGPEGGQVKVVTTWNLRYDYATCPGSGFSFPCDEQGNVDPASLYPAGQASLTLCQAADPSELIRIGVEATHTYHRLCRCGSGQERYALYDARNIFLAYMCPACKNTVCSKYRQEVLTNSQYDTYGEQVDPDE